MDNKDNQTRLPTRDGFVQRRRALLRRNQLAATNADRRSQARLDELLAKRLGIQGLALQSGDITVNTNAVVASQEAALVLHACRQCHGDHAEAVAAEAAAAKACAVVEAAAPDFGDLLRQLASLRRGSSCMHLAFHFPQDIFVAGMFMRLVGDIVAYRIDCGSEVLLLAIIGPVGLVLVGEGYLTVVMLSNLGLEELVRSRQCQRLLQPDWQEHGKTSQLATDATRELLLHLKDVTPKALQMVTGGPLRRVYGSDPLWTIVTATLRPVLTATETTIDFSRARRGACLRQLLQDHLPTVRQPLEVALGRLLYGSYPAAKTSELGWFAGEFFKPDII